MVMGEILLLTEPGLHRQLGTGNTEPLIVRIRWFHSKWIRKVQQKEKEWELFFSPYELRLIESDRSQGVRRETSSLQKLGASSELLCHSSSLMALSSQRTASLSFDCSISLVF